MYKYSLQLYLAILLLAQLSGFECCVLLVVNSEDIEENSKFGQSFSLI